MLKELLGQRYRLIERIGEGGMAYVYLALDEKLGRKVAVKVLHSHMEKNQDIRKRFQMEAQAISSLDHPNIVKIYDFSGDQSEKLWIVTEVITGSNLADYLADQRENYLPMIVATCIVREITKALDRAHSQKIVHRDIKPENVMMTVDGRIKLMDFGIAKDMQHTGMTVTGTFMGSPSYMSPEQIRGKDVDFKTDIYSLSVLYYEILTGRLPFVGKSTHDVVMQIMEGIYTFPRFLVPNILPEIDQEIIRGMSMDPRKRHDSIEKYGLNLDQILKKAGFDESHIELERYKKNPSEYFKNLAQRQKITEASPNRPLTSATNPRNRRKTDYQSPPHQSVRKAGALESEKTQLLQENRVFSPRATYGIRQTQQLPSADPSPPSPNETRTGKSTKRLSLREKTGLNPITRRPPEQGAERSPVREPASRDTYREPPAARKTELLSDAESPSVAVPRPTVRYQPPPAPPPGRINGQELPVPPRQPAPRVQHQKVVKRRPPIALVRTYRPEFLPYFFGLLWVAMVIFLTTWGFFELNKYLSTNSPKNQTASQGEKKGKQTRKPKQESESPVDIFKPNSGAFSSSSENQGPPTTKTPRTNEGKDKSSEKGLPRESLTETSSEGPKVKAPVKQTKTRVIKQLPSQEKNGLVIETNIIRQKKIKKSPPIKVASLPKQPLAPRQNIEPPFEPPVERKTPPAPAPQAPSPTLREEPSGENESASQPAPEKPAGSGKSRILVSSMPAAEVFIDDMKIGNTNDATSSTGWLVVSPGQHTLELRRNGYTPHRMTFEVGEDAQLVIPRIELKPSFGQSNEPTVSSSAERRGIFQLTVRVTHTPATLMIRNLETNNLQTIVLKSPYRTLTLEPSRYHIRVEYAGKVHERSFSNKVVQGNYTFFAEF